MRELPLNDLIPKNIQRDIVHVSNLSSIITIRNLRINNKDCEPAYGSAHYKNFDPPKKEGQIKTFIVRVGLSDQGSMEERNGTGTGTGSHRSLSLTQIDLLWRN